MKTMDFTIYVRRQGSTNAPWPERYQKETDDPEKYGRELIDWFNLTCRAGEPKREFIRVEVHGEINPIDHKWSKTNIITKTDASRPGLSYDEVKCDQCGITGRRYGLSEYITRDRKFAHQRYVRCDWRTIEPATK